MKIAIIGSAFAGNKGASAMLESSVQHLSRRGEDPRFVLLSMYPRSDAEQNPFANLNVLDASPMRLGVLINGTALAWRILPPLRRALERAVPEVGALASADVLLDEGGITFVDGRGKFLIYNMASILPALFVKTPVVKVAQAMGPFTERQNKLAARALLPKVAAIISRGAITHQHLVEFGLTNIHAGADLAFTLELTDADVAEGQAAADRVAPGFFDSDDVVGFSPSAVLQKSAASRGEDYVAQVRAQIDHLTEVLGKKVFLVAHSARAKTTKTHNNDLPLTREIYAGLASKDKVLFIDDELSSQALRHLIGRCEVFVASRFHAMVSSLSMGVPTFVIGWSHKYREVLEMFGQEDFAVGHKELTEDTYRSKVAELLDRKEEIAIQVSTALVGVRANAMKQVDIIEQVASGARN
ncbi:polysaccharide pyruvyl transferase family protein [Bogoriella caseilytica]|uniref:Polysaccharide pyruvyl transferase WcaK-like protein n=1 Tax=Bogoriella caseilytica TaxID=56055 RepID=A0A3N2BAL6_9MICO|nr:polysaccharide pyruvyl transferase family protein [Bogoriella caseilytica]ROR72114.1 polysaccharide pyruvyl transferase WcaK-like protein [Bogoriella caseilytica]